MTADATTTDAMTGGFADPVFQSQAVFRALLDGFARPGTIVEIPDVAQPPAPLYKSVAALIATLADEGTPVHIDPALAGAAVDWIRFHTSAPATATPDMAAFAIAVDSRETIGFSEFALGSAEYPDRSTTLIIQVESISRETALKLDGPGIKDTVELNAEPLPADFVERMGANNALFPRGIDIVLASPTTIVALPRSVRVRDGRAG